RGESPFSLRDCLLKYLLFFSNLLFTVLGLVVLALGLWGLINKESFAQEKIGQISTDPMLVFVVLGLVLSTLCLSGCVGALRENCCLLQVFSATVLVLVAAQVLAAIVAYSFQGQIEGYLRSGMLAAMVRYQDDLDLRFITDEIQIGLQCCGNGTVWNSQCGVGSQQLDEFSAQSVIFLGGCLGGMSRWIEQHTGLIGSVDLVE
uniref:Tetraspanin n=1 Tax=Oncorhynchus tshawytscha TaxID=74940 RepID=A0AAZ3RF75_ONCTS